MYCPAKGVLHALDNEKYSAGPQKLACPLRKWLQPMLDEEWLAQEKGITK